MRKMIFILCIPTVLLSACSPSGMQGNPAAVQAGAAIGGVLGAIVGDRAGGYNGSHENGRYAERKNLILLFLKYIEEARIFTNKCY